VEGGIVYSREKKELFTDFLLEDGMSNLQAGGVWCKELFTVL
jgi:hypothetical protein